jgi:hypothetical protein
MRVLKLDSQPLAQPEALARARFQIEAVHRHNVTERLPQIGRGALVVPQAGT